MWGRGQEARDYDRCPNCGMPVLNPYDIRLCGGGCGRMICPRCSVMVSKGGIRVPMCYSCAGTKKGLLGKIWEKYQKALAEWVLYPYGRPE